MVSCSLMPSSYRAGQGRAGQGRAGQGKPQAKPSPPHQPIANTRRQQIIIKIAFVSTVIYISRLTTTIVYK